MTESSLARQDREPHGDFSLAIIMSRSPSPSPWLDYQWQVVGVIASEWDGSQAPTAAQLVHQQGDTQQFLNAGFRLQLHVDECESYYHNLCSPTPSCFVMATPDSEGMPVPFLVSLSFDEANAYLEGEEQVFSVAMPPELYRWCEQFVVHHYVPEKKKKRRLKDWKR